MPKLILNGKEYANNKPDGYPPLIYSDEEREVGVWRDGRPLYEKTVHTGAIRTTNVSVAHNIQNLKDVVYMKGYCKIDDGRFIPLPFVQGNSGATNYQVRVDVNATNVILSSVSLTDGADSYITIQYTKTTDVPGSGKYTTYGGLAHHYSTTEQIIGTWIDGKPIYEKTITGGSTSGNTGIDLTSLSIDQFIGVDSGATYAKRADNSVLITLNFNAPNGATYGWTIEYNKSNNYLYIGLNAFALTEYSITIRYTKTTD